MTLDGEAETLGWHLIEKNLYLLASDRQGWLHLKQKQAAELTSGELVIKSIRVGTPPHSAESLWTTEGSTRQHPVAQSRVP